MKCLSHFLIKLIALCAVLIGQFVYADDFASISDHIGKTAGVQSCTKGYNLFAGKIGYQQPLIKGALPFVIDYQAAIRADGLSGMDYFIGQSQQGAADWGNNYSSFMLVQSGSGSAIYQFKLLGSNESYIFISVNGVLKRAYVYGGLSSLGGGFLSTDTREITLTQSGSSFIVKKDGISYTFGSSTILNTGAYAAPTTNLLRITSMVDPRGKSLSLNYDANNNLMLVKDNRNNT